MGTIEKYQPIVEAARAGGEILKKYFGQALVAEEKTMAGDFKTIADEESEAAILNILKEAYPTYSILAEESGEKKSDSEYTLVIDPLDGTNIFFLGIAYFALSIALVTNDRIEFGLVYNPITNQPFHAASGAGAYLNDTSIHASSEGDLKKSTIGYVAGYANYKDDASMSLIRTMYREKDVKRYTTNWCGTLDLCQLACGRIEAVINNDTEPYDFLAGELIAREAGAVITDFSGKKDRFDNGIFLASGNQTIHDAVLSIL